MPSQSNNYNYIFYISGLIIGGIKRVQLSRCGQVLAEYALVLGLVAAVLTGLSVYVQRGLQGRYKDATDVVLSDIRVARGELGKDELTKELGENLPRLPLRAQYEPYYQESKMTTTTTNAKNVQSYREPRDPRPGVVRRTIAAPDAQETISRSGWRIEKPFSDAVR